MNRSIQALAALIVVVGTINAQAAAKYWDSSATDGLQHGNGVWNDLTVSNWNTAANGSGALSTWVNADTPYFNGSNGTSVITITNSVTTASANLVMQGAQYTINIVEGGILNGYIAYLGEGSRASNNTLNVIGGNSYTSTFNAQYDIHPGRGGTNFNNRLIVDGAGYPGSAVATNVRDIVVGDGLGSISNGVQIINGGRVYMNTTAADLRLGDNPGSMGNYLTVTNGSLLNQTVSANIQVGRASATNNSVLIQGGELGPSLWTLSSSGNNLHIGNGDYSVGNRVTIDGAGTIGGAIITNAGANVDTFQIAVGAGTGADSNRLEIINGGIMYLSTVPNINLNVGFGTTQRNGNSLLISNGGQLSGFYNFSIGGPSSSNNYVLVQGGAIGTSLLQMKSNGYRINVGPGANSFNNRLIIDGMNIPGSAMVTNKEMIEIGLTGAGAQSNSVQVVNGGILWNSAATYIGNVAGSFGNYMMVTNGGEFRSGGEITVGRTGSGANGSSNNWLLVQGGGANAAIARSTTGGNVSWNIGAAVNCNNNRVTIDGLGVAGSAIVTNVSPMSMGIVAGANDNRLEVRNKGELWLAENSILQVGVVAGSTGSVISVNGGDIHHSTPRMLGTLGTLEILNGGRYLMSVGNHTLIGSGAGVSNTLSVASGGLLHGTFYGATIKNIEIGDSGSTGNLLRVDGGTVTNFATIFVGGSTGAGSKFNEMVITNGGKMYSGLGSIGASAAGQASNRVTVTGSGSLWDLKGANITLGLHTTTGNVLAVEAGGMVTNVGTLNVASNNTLALHGGTIAVTNINVTNQSVTVIGDGVSTAALDLTGGTGTFTNGLLVASNAMLRGTGVIRTGGATSATLTNGAAISAGIGDASGTLTVSNLTWQGGGRYRCDIANVTGTAGSGWDLLSVRDLTASPDGKKLVVRLSGAAANFSAGQDYSLKILVYTNATGLDAGDFEVVHTGFVGAGNGAWSIAVDAGQNALNLIYSGLVAPTAPSDLSATAPAYNQIDLLWTDNSDNETGFKIERSPNGSSGWTAIFTNAANVNAFTNTGLSGETPYYYRVRAYNTAGDSAYSAVANATTPPGPPADPNALSLTPVSTSQINLSWADNSGNETGFEIQRKTGVAGVYAQIASVAANVTAYTNTGLATDTLYYYQVRATNAAYQSAFIEASASTWPNPPTAPSVLSATAMSKTRIDLGWTDNASNETGFKIERKTGAGGTYAQIATVGANVQGYTNNTGLTADTTYYYRLCATNIGGASSTIEASATTLDDRRYVAKHGLNTNPGTLSQPWGTIQYAVTNVQSGDRILIGEGTYQEDVLFTNNIHDLTLIGGHNTNDWSWNPPTHPTTVSNNTGGNRISFGPDSSIAASNATFVGLTLAGSGSLGRGLYFPYKDPVVTKSTITFRHCEFRGLNQAIDANGGTVALKLENCLFAGNLYGIIHYGGNDAMMTNYISHCTFVTNKRFAVRVQGGAYGAPLIMRNSIITGSWGTSGVWGSDNEGFGFSIGDSHARPVIITHSLVYGNTMLDFHGATNLITFGDGMITNAAPVFVNYAAGNYRLTKDSPGANQGTTIPAITDDLDLNPRPWGRPYYDMGAYEIYSSPLNSVFRFH